MAPKGMRPDADAPTLRRRRSRELGLNLVVAAASTVVLLGVSELAARLTERPATPPADYITDWQAWDGDF